MRERSRTSVIAAAQGYSYNFTSYESDGTQSSSTQGPWTGRDHVEVQTTFDVVTPNFHQAIARGDIINNDFTTSKVTTRTPVPESYMLRRERVVPNSNRKWAGDLRSGASLWSDSRRKPLLEVPSATRAQLKSEARDLAVQGAYANIDASSMLAGASVAESRKTVDFLFSTSKKLYKIAKDVRSLNAKSLSRQFSPKELADRYMELRYAVRPLVYDVNGLIEALSQDRGYNRLTSRGYGSRTYGTEDTISNVEVAWGVKGNISRKVTYSVSARAGVLSEVLYSNSNIFGVDQLAETAWELMPFSFIVDWFVNVGQVVAAVTPNSGVTQLASWVTTKETIVATNSITGSYATPDPYWDRSLQGSFSGSESREELVLSRSKDPQLSVWPTVNIRLDTYKILDLGIILSKALR